MEYETARELVEKDFLSCPSCGSKTIVVDEGVCTCLKCGYEEELEEA